MRFWIVGVLGMCAAPVCAADCYVGSAEALTVDAWRVEVLSKATHRVHLDLTSHLEKPIRMANVEVGFRDVLGNSIGAFRFEPDFSIKPGETVPYQRDIGAMVMPRLATIATEDAVPFFCTLAVVYTDGSTEKFDDASSGAADDSLADDLAKIISP